MSRVTIAEAAEALYKAAHEVLLESEAGKPLSEDNWKRLSDAHETATRVRKLRATVYDDSPDDREVSVAEENHQAARSTVDDVLPVAASELNY